MYFPSRRGSPAPICCHLVMIITIFSLPPSLPPSPPPLSSSSPPPSPHVILDSSHRIRTEKNGGAWCPRHQITKTTYEWLEVDLEKLTVITLVETQGRFGNGQVSCNFHNSYLFFPVWWMGYVARFEHVTYECQWQHKCQFKKKTKRNVMSHDFCSC